MARLILLMVIKPESKNSDPDISDNKVDLPIPFGPIRFRKMLGKFKGNG